MLVAFSPFSSTSDNNICEESLFLLRGLPLTFIHESHEDFLIIGGDLLCLCCIVVQDFNAKLHAQK